MTDNCNLVFDVNGYLPNGLRVFVKNIPLTGIETAVADMLAATNKLIADGLTLEDPAFGKLKSGEKRETINGVLRRKDQKNSDGTMSPTFDLYPDNPALGRRCLIINLDTPEEIADFERATGYKISDFKVYVAAQLNRKEEAGDYAEFAKPITGNLAVVFKDNPAYDPNAEKKKRQHVFIRWETANATPAPQPVPAQTTAAQAGEPAEPVGDEPYNAMLENERCEINLATKTGSVQGVGDKNGDKYEAWGKITGSEKPDVRISVFPEDVVAIRKAGYEFGESDHLNVPVILTTKDRNMTRIGSVIPRKATTADNFNWALVWPKVRGLYKNPDDMQNSVARLKNEGAFKTCADEAAVIAVIVGHKNGQAEGTPA